MKVTTKLNIVITGLKSEELNLNLDNFSFEYAHDSEQTPEEFVTAISGLVDMVNKAIGLNNEATGSFVEDHAREWNKSRAGERPCSCGPLDPIKTSRTCYFCSSTLKPEQCYCDHCDAPNPDTKTELQVGDIVYMANNMDDKIPLYVKDINIFSGVVVGPYDNKSSRLDKAYSRNELHFVKRGNQS